MKIPSEVVGLNKQHENFFFLQITERRKKAKNPESKKHEHNRGSYVCTIAFNPLSLPSIATLSLENS